MASRAMANAPRGHKYGAKATTVDGIRFSSMAEAKRYGELRLLEKGGEIEHLVCQPEFQLCVTTIKGDVAIGRYVADFGYYKKLPNGAQISTVEDVKGFKTPLYRWKKKHVEAQYGIRISEVR